MRQDDQALKDHSSPWSVYNVIRSMLILIVGLLLTFAATLVMKNDADIDASRDFQLICGDIKAQAKTRLYTHAQLLRSGSAFFSASASDSVMHDDWQNFYHWCRIERNLRGFRGLGYAVVVPAGRLENHTLEVRNQGFAGYTVHPVGKRSLYSSILFLEPDTAGNLSSMGYDMLTDAVLRKAMELACDSDMVTISGRTVFDQFPDSARRSGTFMFAPVYHKRSVSTVAERRAALSGWVYSPFPANSMMQGIMGRWDRAPVGKIRLQVYDGDPSPGSILYDNFPDDTPAGSVGSAYQCNMPVIFNGNRWILHFSKADAGHSPWHGKVLITLISGIIITLLLTFLTLTLLNTRRRAWLIAGHLTAKSRDSENRLREVLENSLSASYKCNLHSSTFEYMSPVFCRLTGALTEELKDITLDAVFKAIHPDDRDRVIHFIGESVSGTNRSELQLEYRFLHRDGAYRWFHDQFTVIRDETGEAISRIGSVSDITELRFQRELVEQTRFNYETFFNTIDDLLFVLDMQGNMIHTNKTVTARLGYTWEELAGRSVLLVHPEERREEAGRIVGEMLQGTAAFCPVPVITKTGMQIPVETRVSTGTWDGMPVIFGVTKDISAVKLAEEKFSKLFYLNPSACGLSDLGTRHYIEVNEAFFTLFGFTKEEVLGHTAEELGILSPDARESIQKLADGNGKVVNAYADLRTKSGEIRHVLLSSENMRIQDKVFRFTVVNDLTERIRAEAEIGSKNAELILLNQQKDKFFSILSHDLRSPFSTFLGFTRLLAEELPTLTPDEIRTIATEMRSSANKLFGLLENLLDWSRMQTGISRVNPETFNLLEQIVFITGLISPVSDRKGVTIKTDIPEGISVSADIHMFSSLIRNLVFNAVKFTPSGGFVTIGATHVAGSRVVIFVQDTGIGMSEAIIGKLFNLDGNTGRKGTDGEPSSGLGLILCREYAGLHGGTLEAEGSEGKGSRFWFTLPPAV